MRSMADLITPRPDFVVDQEHGIYHWNGERRSLADLTAVGAGHTSTDLSWLQNSNALTIMVEYAVPNTGLSATGQVLFSLSGSGSNRLEVYSKTDSSTEGLANVFYGPNSSYFNTNGNLRSLGRKRLIVSIASGHPVRMAQDAEPVTEGANASANGGFAKWGIGVRSLDDNLVSEATIYKVHIWPRYMSVLEIEAVADYWDCRAKPLLINGSSLNNERLYSDGGGLWSRVFREIKTDGYVPFRNVAIGGTNPTQQVAVYENLPSRYHAFNLGWAEIGLDITDFANPGNGYLAAIERMRALNTADWMIFEPSYSATMRKAKAGNGLAADDIGRRRRDDAWDNNVALAWPDRIIYTKSVMQEAAPDDADLLAYDVWPQELSVDGVHQNQAGQEALALNSGGVKDQLRLIRWI